MAQTWTWLSAALLLVPAATLSAQDASAAVPASKTVAEEKSWSVDVGLDWADQYVFRGVNLLGDGQEVLVLNATLTVGNFSAWSYGYLGKFDGEDGEGDYTEIDLGADYTFSSRSFSLTLGALTYQYTGEVENSLGSPDSEELYAIAAWDVLLTPTLSYYHDIDAVDGGYLTLGLSHSFPVSESVSFDLSGTVGIDNKYIGVESFKFNDLLLGLDVPWQMTESFSLHAMVQQSIALDVLDELEVDDETVFTVGSGFSF